VSVDDAFRIEDKDWLPVLYKLIQEEGLSLGGSSALNVLGAMQLARELGPGKTIVTVLCDYANRYMGKLFNPEFLRAQSLPAPPWMAS
jgi:cysteine synthase A